MNSHHELSPSKYNGWAECVHYESADRSSKEAKGGAVSHDELHNLLTDSEYDSSDSVAVWASMTINNYLEKTEAVTFHTEAKVIGIIPGVEGVFGTPDVYWEGKNSSGNKVLYIADLKTYSDGSNDYTPQLKGYATLLCQSENRERNDEVHLIVLHGAVKKADEYIMLMGECIDQTRELLKRVRDKEEPHHICKWCKYCACINTCPAACKAIDKVENQSPSFEKLSLPQKLVVCEAVEKIISNIKAEAKEKARENGGVLESDGIRYEIKVSNGTPKLRDILDVVNSVRPENMKWFGSNSELLKLCELPKTKFTKAVKEINKDNKSIKKIEIDKWCASFYECTSTKESLVRIN